jgi:prefoldin subunit 5
LALNDIVSNRINLSLVEFNNQYKHQITKINNNIDNHFNRIRLQIGAETSIATKDIFIRYNQLFGGLSLNIDRSLIRFSENSIAIQNFTTNYQKANIKKWKETKNLTIDSEKTILHANYHVEDKVEITIKNTRKSIDMIDELPKKEEIKDTMKETRDESLSPKFQEVNSTVVNSYSQVMDEVRKLADKINDLKCNMSQEFQRTQETLNSVKRSNSSEDLQIPFKDNHNTRNTRRNKDPKPPTDKNPKDNIKVKIMIAARNCKDLLDLKKDYN